jgi:hypothetical protein
MRIYSNINYKILLKQFISLPSHKIFINSNIKNNIDTIPKYIDIPDMLINDSIDIPINIATYTNIKYYNVQLYNIFDIINFDTDLELTNIYRIPADFNSLKINNSQIYYSAINSDNRGYYILGKVINDKIRLSGFIIPYYKGILIPPKTLYSDTKLIGTWLLVK